ncbi:MAG: Rossmann-like and DUF2520 domain-containing protein [Salinivenus sp.]
MSAPAAPSDPPPAAIIGAGAVGTALAQRLRQAGYEVRAIVSRTAADARALAEQVGAPTASDRVADLPPDVRLVFLCVPDDAISAVAEHLAATEHSWAQTVVAHTSGRCTAAALAPLADAAAPTLSFHPLQTFPPGTPPEAFDDIAVAVEGGDEAVAAGQTLAEALGARPVVLSAADKERYHTAAALASNGLAALMGVVNEVLDSTSLRGTDAADLFGPLVEQTWENVKAEGGEGALTGPVVRGDQETVAAHLEALEENTPHLVPLYAALSTEMARLAVRRGRLAPRAARRLFKQLREAVESASGPPH